MNVSYRDEWDKRLKTQKQAQEVMETSSKSKRLDYIDAERIEGSNCSCFYSNLNDR